MDNKNNVLHDILKEIARTIESLSRRVKRLETQSFSGSRTIIPQYTASYIVQRADPQLIGAQPLSSLPSGFLHSTYGTGVLKTYSSITPGLLPLTLAYTDRANTFTVGPQTIQTTSEQLRLSYNAGNYASFTTGSGGNLTVAPTGDFVFDPTGLEILPATGYELNIGSLQKKYLTLHAAELWVETLVAQQTIATIGGRVLVGPTNILINDVTLIDTGIVVKYNNIAVNDIIYLEAGGKVEFMRADSYLDLGGSYYYGVTRDLDGSGANLWYAGDAVFNTGTTGDGFIDLYSTSGVLSGSGPTIVGNVRNSNTYNDWDEHWAIGNLNGVYGYGADTYGVALGKYAASENHLTIDTTNGIQFFEGTATVIGQFNATTITLGEVAGGEYTQIASTGIDLYANGVARISMTSAGALTIKNSSGNAVFTFDASAGAEFTLPLTLATTGGIYQGTGTFAAPTTGLKIWNDGGKGRIAGYNASTLQWYGDTDGILYSGGGAVYMSENGLFITAQSPAYENERVIHFIGGNGDIGHIWAEEHVATVHMFTLEGYTSNSLKTQMNLETTADITLTPGTGFATIVHEDLYTDAWTDYSATSTITGWSAYTTKKISYKLIGKWLFVAWNIVGTSDNTVSTFTLPYSRPADGFTMNFITRSQDSGGSFVAGRTFVDASSNLVDSRADVNSAAWTNSGTKATQGELSFEIA